MRDIEEALLDSDSTDHLNKRGCSLFLKRKDVLAEIARPIGGDDLKLNLLELRRKSGLPFEETRFTCIFQIKFI